MTMKGFSFGGGHSSSFNIKITKIDRSALPSISLKTIDAPNMEGVYDAGVKLGDRKVQVSFILLSQTDEERTAQLRELAGWIFKRELQPLEFDDELGKVYQARIENVIDLEEVHTYGEGTLTFFIPIPFAEDKNATTYSFDGGTTGTINYDGTFKCFPTITFTINQPLNQIVLNRMVTGEPQKNIVLNGTFVAGDTVVVDCIKGKVTLNGTNAMMMMTLTSDFIDLLIGQNTFFTTVGVTAQIQYKQRYL
jgi:predicted phage tail component-like protein